MKNYSKEITAMRSDLKHLNEALRAVEVRGKTYWELLKLITDVTMDIEKQLIKERNEEKEREAKIGLVLNMTQEIMIHNLKAKRPKEQIRLSTYNYHGVNEDEPAANVVSISRSAKPDDLFLYIEIENNSLAQVEEAQAALRKAMKEEV